MGPRAITRIFVVLLALWPNVVVPATFTVPTSDGQVFTINENEAINTEVTNFTVTQTAGNSIVWTLSGCTTNFNIVGAGTNNVIGTVKTSKVLNYESGTTTYSCTASAAESGTTTVTRTFTVEVRNVVDVPPAFGAASYTCTVAEEVAAGTGLTCPTAISVSDSESGDTFTCAISGSYSELFTVNTASCAVSVKNKNDRETMAAKGPFNALILTATDSASLSSTASLTVSITDINDNNPVCTPSTLSISIPENTASGATLQSISCTDADSGVNADMDCSTSTTGYTATWSGSVCALKTATTFDYDTMSPTTQSVVLYVNDNGTTKLTTSITFSTTITGVNDNNPTWGTWVPAKPASVATVIATIDENSAVGTTVFTAVATDADKGETVAYSIVSVTNGLTSYFTINGGTVKVALAGLNRETHEDTNITVSASDGTNSITATVRVAIGSVNEFAPVFSPSSIYSVSVSEGLAANVDVQTMTVQDPDVPTTAVVCEITSGNSANVWQLKSGATNILQTKSQLVIDQPTALATSYSLGVLCKDNNAVSPFKSSAASIAVTINDNSNDHTPTISVAPTTVSLSESATTVDVATISVADNDGGTPGETTCSITSPASSPFGLDACTKLKRTAPLDYDTMTPNKYYEVVVRVQDKGTTPKYGSATVTVSVLNADDNDPTCPNSPFSFTQSETATTNTVVGTVICQDADNEGFTYSIIDSGMPFVIGSTSGELNVSAALDYDDKAAAPYYQFKVRAVDKGSRGLSTTAQVTVTVTNVNEATPTFTTKTYSTAENTAAGTLLTTFTATDSDGGVDGQLVYALSSTSNGGAGKFMVDASTAKVTLLSALDYEASGFSPKHYELTITATDKSSSPKSGTGTLTISVTDVNDGIPVFASTTYSGSVAENSAIGASVSGGPVAATDSDSAGTFGTVHYSITAGNTGSVFQIGTTSGAVTVAATTLNYESTNSYTLTIKATDNAGAGPNTATCAYVISITDVNEFDPVFSPSSVSQSLAEDTALDAVVYTASASDTDSGQSLTYFLDPTHSSFTINAANGEIKLAQTLNYESTTSYSLTVKAKDSVATLRTGTLALTVSVTDVNEFTPSCVANPSTASRNESTTGTVLSLTCTDSDTTKTFVYTINSVNGVSGSGKFSFSGADLRLSTAIDYETDTADRTNTVIMVINDSGPGTAKSTSVTATVSILPVNEVAPTITSAATATVAENAVADTTIHTFTGTDTDQGLTHGTITWSIQSGNTHNYYKIDGSLLKVSAVSPDRENEATATLKIRATDGGGLYSEQDLTVTVTDVNDNAPVFNPTSKAVTVVETAAVGFTVDDFSTAGRVTDADTGASAAVTLSIASGADSKFTMDGQLLKVAAALSASTKNYYELTIRATDGGTNPSALSTDMTLVINVVEVNSVPPTFTVSGSTVTVREDTAIGATIYDANATDTDGGLAGTIKFALQSGDTYNNFLVDEGSGKVIIRAALDYEQPLKVHNLVIRANDSGTPIKTGTMTLTVSVTDYNDNQPVFTSAISKTINENIGSGQTVLTAAVSDGDSGSNRDVTFSFSSAAGIFAINSASGVITTTSDPDRETQETYVLQLKAVDQGTPALTGYQTLTITIADMNDNTPTFSGAPYVYAVNEDASVGFQVTTAVATDTDKPGSGNSQITYSLFPADGTSDTSFFSIDSNAVISVAKALDRETTNYYQFHVLAKDAGSPVLTGTLAINISVSDVNDNTPTIYGSPYTTTISEASGQGVAVQQINATDKDIGNNAVLTYTVVSGDTSGLFTTTTAGMVVTAKSTGLDREATAQYTLLVQVNDNGSPKLSATATVSLSLVDVNDNAPTFASNFTRSVAEKSPVDTNVGAVVTATDADTGANAAISYVISSQTPVDGHFKIDTSTGQIQVAQASLDRETVAQYNLVVQARDNGSPSLTGSATVTVLLTDVNDNAPVFGATYSVGLSLAENVAVGTVVTTISATDADKASDPNSNITYSIDTSRAQGSKASILFNLGATSGVLTVKTSPDHEVDTSVSFYVTATDQGSSQLSASTYVVVTITDLNDNRPVFNQSFYEGELAANDVYDTVILQVLATDADSGSNGEVKYSFVENAVYVLISSTTGKVTRAANQQPKAGDKHIHIVGATDLGSPAQRSEVQIRIDIYDPATVVVKITFSLSQSSFVAQLMQIIQALRGTLTFKYPRCSVKYWRHETSTVTNTVGRRRLLANGVAAHFYVVADNSTSTAANIVNTKKFITNQELLTFWTSDSIGTPTPVLRGTGFTNTPIVTVERYPQTVTQAWYTTTWGIAVLAVCGAIFLLAVGLIAFFCVRLYQRRQRRLIRHTRIVSVVERPYAAPVPKERIPPPKYGLKEPYGRKDGISPPPPYTKGSSTVYRDPKLWVGNDKKPLTAPKTAGRAVDYERAPTPADPPLSRTRLIVTSKGVDDNESGKVTPVDF